MTTPAAPDPTSLVSTTPSTTSETPKTETQTETPAAPEPITADALVLPEGFEANDELKGEFLEIMNNRDLSPIEQANKLLALQGKALQLSSDASSSSWTDLQTTWQNEVRNDPDVGGAKLEPTLGKISKIVDEFGTPELRGVFDLTGAGNNPHVIKFLAKVADKLTEGSAVPGAVPTGDSSLAQQLYPTMRK